MEWKENECAPQRQNNWAFKILLQNRKTMDFHSFFTGCITALQQPCLQFILVLPPKINGTHRPPKYTYCMSQFFFWKGFTLKKNAYYWAMDSSHRFAKSVFFLPKLIWSSYSRNEGSQSWGCHPKIISTMSTFDAKTFDKEGVKIILGFLWLCTKSLPSHYPLLHLGHPKSFFAEKSAF